MTLEARGIESTRRTLVRVQSLLKGGNKQIMADAGEEIIKIIISRTRRGKEVGDNTEGESFKSYNSKYKKRKKGSWLYESGSMLSSMDKTATNKAVRVYFKKTKHWESNISNWKLAFIHNTGEGKQKKREFVGLNKRELEFILKGIEKDLFKEIDRIMRSA